MRNCAFHVFHLAEWTSLGSEQSIRGKPEAAVNIGHWPSNLWIIILTAYTYQFRDWNKIDLEKFLGCYKFYLLAFCKEQTISWVCFNKCVNNLETSCLIVIPVKIYVAFVSLLAYHGLFFNLSLSTLHTFRQIYKTYIGFVLTMKDVLKFTCLIKKPVTILK
jgi:hypothetical protein